MRWPLNGQAASLAKRIILYGGAISVLYVGGAWLHQQAATSVTRPVLVALAEERRARVAADTMIIGKLEAIVQGQALILDAAREGIYTKAQIDRMKFAGDREHRRLEEGQVLDRARIEKLEARRR